MATETEAKFRCPAFEPVRARLRALDARRSGRVLETNRLFDTPDRRLRQADCGLRIRECRRLGPASSASAEPAALLTYKGPRGPGELKSREETETSIEDPVALMSIFEQLGFQEVIVYEKRRETWHLDRCEIALDELPRMGLWIEIEGPDAAAVENARSRLNLAAEPVIRETYVEMAATHGEEDARGRRRLVFDDPD